MTLEAIHIEKKVWGKHHGKDVFLFRLQNETGAFVEVTNYGASLVSVNVPDKLGKQGNVVLGFPSLEGYVKDSCYIGSTIGRIANRIGGASFVLDNQMYCLDKNDGVNNNHGGKEGFHNKVFDAAIHNHQLRLTYTSPHGEGGFPGNLVFRVTYSWSITNELLVQYSAITDMRTVCNFTNHAYFNLSAGDEKIDSHQLYIASRQVVETTEDYIPTGNVLPAHQLSFQSQRLKEKFTIQHEREHGLNTYYIFDPSHKPTSLACALYHNASGRKLNIFTTYPGVQLYTGDYLKSETAGLQGNNYEPFDGVCLECQYYPDSPNHPHFPTVVLNPEQEYKEYIAYQFSVE